MNDLLRHTQSEPFLFVSNFEKLSYLCAHFPNSRENEPFGSWTEEDAVKDVREDAAQIGNDCTRRRMKIDTQSSSISFRSKLPKQAPAA